MRNTSRVKRFICLRTYSNPRSRAARAIVGLCISALLGNLMTNTPAGAAGHPAATYVNPVIDRDFPDPCILDDGSYYYAYATNGQGGILPCAKSPDLVHWTALPDAMPKLAPWVNPGRTWAPDVSAIRRGKKYLLYFTAHDRAANTQAIGVATSNSPEGPFISDAAEPFISQPELGGCIDPFGFVDDDKMRYIVWKNDGNSRGQDTWIWIQKTSDDGLTRVGEPTKLIKQDQHWEGPLVEAPALLRHDGKYYLFYSANGYGGCEYAMGYAVSDSLLGPYTKPRTVAWQASTGDVCGPGGQDIVTDSKGKMWMAYHSWGKGPHSYRSMSIDPLIWNGDVPYLLGPSKWEQTAPPVKKHR